MGVVDGRVGPLTDPLSAPAGNRGQREAGMWKLECEAKKTRSSAGTVTCGLHPPLIEHCFWHRPHRSVINSLPRVKCFVISDRLTRWIGTDVFRLLSIFAASASI